MHQPATSVLSAPPLVTFASTVSHCSLCAGSYASGYNGLHTLQVRCGALRISH